MSKIDCNPYTSPLGSAALTQSGCPNPFTSKLGSAVLTQSVASVAPANYLDVAKKIVADATKVVGDFFARGSKAANGVYEKASECVNNGEIRVGKGPVEGATVSTYATECGYVKAAKDAVTAQFSNLPSVTGTVTGAVAAVVSAYTEMNSKYSASAKILGKDVTVGACDLAVGVVALGAATLAVKALMPKTKETGYKLKIN